MKINVLKWVQSIGFVPHRTFKSKSASSVLFSLFIAFVVFFSISGCENRLDMVLPKGPKGDPGASAFELWKQYYGKDPATTMEEFFNSLKGKDGKDGAVPVIGANGNWWISGVDTQIPARGKDGKDGVTPTIGANGNWYIAGVDTGLPSRGRDGFSPYIKDGNWWINDNNTGVPARGADGKDGKTPTVEISAAPGYFWVINGITTTISAKGVDGKDGKDGQDGYTPVIGANGNWFINSVDTGKPSAIIPVIGVNGNWFVGGNDTGMPARGPKGDNGNNGVDGKTAYELWKDGVSNGTMINKDGSKYTGGNTWEDFLRWLQGGDVSVLYQHWLKQGNTGSMDAFLAALFDCHCDGITITVIAADNCVSLNADGTLSQGYNATLKVGGTAGTSVSISGDGYTATGSIPAGQTETSFTVPRTDNDRPLTINCTASGSTEQVTKTAKIPALKYIKLGAGTPVTVTKVDGEEKDLVSITFATAPSQVLIGATVIYDGTAASDGWTVSADTLTFTKTYDRAATAQAFTVVARGANGQCSTLNNLFTVPQLTPVTVNALGLSGTNECDRTLTLTGTAGMTVTATGLPPGNGSVTLTESPAGTYTATVPRAYTSYTMTVTSSKAGAGTRTQTIPVNGANLLPAPFTVSWTGNPGSSSSIASVTATFTNQLTKPIAIVISRPANMPNERNPWLQGNVSAGQASQTINLPALGSQTLTLQRDVTPSFAAGSYVVTMSSASQCIAYTATAQTIVNQTNFNYSFNRKVTNPTPYPGGNAGNGGSSNLNNNYPVPTPMEGYTIFEVTVTDAIPNSYIQFILNTSEGSKSVWGASKQLGPDGGLKILVQMKDTDIAIANGGTGEFRFFATSSSSTPTYSKTFTFTAPQ